MIDGEKRARVALDCWKAVDPNFDTAETLVHCIAAALAHERAEAHESAARHFEKYDGDRTFRADAIAAFLRSLKDKQP